MGKRFNVLEGSITHALLFLMAPILICGIAQQVYSMVDGIVVGRFVGSVGVATIGGSCNTLIGFFTGVTSNLILGCMTVMAFLYGRSDSKISSGITTSIYISLICGGCFSMIYILGAEWILTLLKVPEELVHVSASYLRLYACGFIPYSLFQLTVNAYRAFGETRMPTLLMIGSFGVNIALDCLFVGLSGLQQNGIAYAYLCTQLLFASVSIIGLSRTYMIHLFREKLDYAIMKRILRIAVPACIASSFYSITNLMVQSSMNMLGSDVIAAFAIHSKIENVFWVIMSGFGVAMTTVISQNSGARAHERVRKGVRSGMVLCFALTAVISFLFFMQKHQLISLFTSETRIQILASSILTVMTPYYLFYPILEVISDSLKCLGRAPQSTILTLVSVCLIRVSWIMLYVRNHLTLNNILFAYPLSWACASILFMIYYEVNKKQMLHSVSDHH